MPVLNLKNFFKQHILWLVLLAVTIPLLIITYLQYRSLVTLGTTLPVYRKQVMREYLGTVSEDVYNFYRNNANDTLGVPASAIPNRKGGIIQDDREKKVIVKSVAPVAQYFKDKQFKGAKRYFIVVVAEFDGTPRNVTFFYDAGQNQMVRDDQAPEWRAIQVAFAPYVFYIQAQAKLSASPMGIDRDPMNLLIVKPILDDDGQIVALAGMVVNQEFFMEEYLPQVIQKHQQKFFPEDYQDAVVTLRDENEELQLATAEVKSAKDEVTMGFGLIFRRLHLGMFMRSLTHEQWAKRYFVFNLTTSVIMMFLLIGGIVMALRTVSRSMKLSQMKADFVSNVSHELRTPLASIRVFAEFLRLGRVKDTKKIQEYGEYIENESRRLTQLINNILDFSRIESGQKTYHFEEANVIEIVDETIKSFDVRLTQNGFTVTLDIPEEPLPPAKIDSSAIAQALVNLLDNAAKYSGEEKEINVRVAKKEGFITIAVSDKGIGIPLQEQEKIFEKFYRVSTGLVHDVKGSGLGLSIVKHIVEAHQGKVTVKSKQGYGTTFTVYLPIRWITGEIMPIQDSGINEYESIRQSFTAASEEEILVSNK
jgi:signal transduction histidine kinase